MKPVNTKKIQQAYVKKCKELGSQRSELTVNTFNSLINSLMYFGLIDHNEYFDLLVVRDTMNEYISNGGTDNGD